MFRVWIGPFLIFLLNKADSVEVYNTFVDYDTIILLVIHTDEYFWNFLQSILSNNKTIDKSREYDKTSLYCITYLNLHNRLNATFKQFIDIIFCKIG